MTPCSDSATKICRFLPHLSVTSSCLGVSLTFREVLPVVNSTKASRLLAGQLLRVSPLQKLY
jgi:hypothetical protein